MGARWIKNGKNSLRHVNINKQDLGCKREKENALTPLLTNVT